VIFTRGPTPSGDVARVSLSPRLPPARIRALFLVQGPSTPRVPASPPSAFPMASRDLRRLLDGAALVAREATRGTSPRDVLRSALLAATDLAGLTKGTPRRPQDPPGAGPHPATESSRPSSSVVYFTHDDAAATQQEPPLERPPPLSPPAQEPAHPARTQITGTGTAAAVVAEPAAVAAASPDPVAAPPEPSPLPPQAPPLPSPASVEKRRRLRERRVPSTPFTRALG
jgi:aarF domain-containing kinase